MFKGDACNYLGCEMLSLMCRKNCEGNIDLLFWGLSTFSTDFESLFALKMEVKDGREAWKPIGNFVFKVLILQYCLMSLVV